MERSLSLGIAGGFALLAAFILANAGLAYRNIRRLHDDTARVAHTHEVRGALDDLLSTLKDAETGQRGFLITGEARYLKPYEDAVAAVPGRVERIRQLTGDNPHQGERIPRLSDLVGAKLDELARTIALRQGPGFAAARQAVMTNQGKEVMDDLRAAMAEMQQDEEQLLQARQGASDRAYLIALASSMAGGGVGLAAAGAFFGMLRRHLTSQGRAAAVVQQQREELRQQAEALREAGQRKDQLRLMLAHELRNPLAAIRSTIQLWQRLPDVARTPASLEAVLGAVDRLSAFAGRLLQVSHAQEVRRCVDLNGVVAEALDLLQARAAAQDVDLERDLAPGLPPIWGSASALHQVVLNLASNALQAMPHGGRLSCATRIDPTAALLELRVRDSGPGIADADRPHLFGLFFSTRPEGTGLGLALCREIVTQHGGTIVLEDGRGPGASFLVSLPIARDPREQAP